MTISTHTRLGPYEILELVGAGGMGEVYRARDTRLERTVAIKILPGHASGDVHRTRFRDEARALSSLNHPRICALYDVGHVDGVDFAVMEYLEGETLADRLAARPMRVDQILRHATEIAEALDAAHRRGFVHGDLKPSNVMLTPTGAKLLDFGIARWREPHGSEQSISLNSGTDGSGRATRQGTELRTATLNGNILGTLHYMAPEQIEGHEVDARADIFAFGAVLYEMIAGRKAFEGANPDEVLTASLEREPLPLSSASDAPLPPALDRLVTRCLAKDREDRWQTARDLASELQWISQTHAQGGQPRPAQSRGLKTTTRGLTAGVFLGGAIVAVAVAAIRFSRTPPSSDALRFEVPPAAGTVLSPSASLLAISPNGRLLAFLASRPGGQTRIWVRSLDSLVLRELPGTDGALGPFWSPDSQYLAFFADAKLKKVGLSGEPPVTLCDFPTGGPVGTWGSNGVMLVWGPAGIYRAAATGGSASLIESRNAEGGSQRILPTFLPDGRHFLSLARSTSDSADDWIVLRSIDSSDERRLLSADSQALYADPGYLVFLKQGKLFAQQFDLRRLQLVGAPVPIPEATHVGINPANKRGMFSVSQSGALAYRASEERALTWFDRNGRPGDTAGLAGLDQEPAISPDGRWLAVSRDDPATTRSIWILDLTGNTAPARVPLDQKWAASPIWSFDGNRLIFSCSEVSQASLTRGICEKRLTGSGDREFRLDLPGTPEDSSPDGRFLLYQAARDSAALGSGRGAGLGTNGSDLWLTEGSGTSPTKLTRGASNERLAQISPNGRWMAYASDSSGRNEIYVRSFPTADTPRQISTSGGTEPHWRGDGKELFYLGADQVLRAVPVNTEGAFGAGMPTSLFATRMEANARLGIIGRNQYAVSADGQRFLINQPPVDANPVPITVVVNWQPTPSR